ncbi:IS5 family transposase [Hoylesella loescheii]|uniref:IS5 family transposase n=1 Tax=Hoylesella loescheii TaxID=840 RepID=UPI0028E954F0|nr:IS5 family transposase [Hoylesella loescheii]
MYEVLDKDTIKFEILPHLSVAKRGYVSKSDLLEVIQCILYKLKTGCQWHMLPVSSVFTRRVLHYKTVYGHFRKWSRNGEWEKVWGIVLKRYKSFLDMSCVDLDGSHTTALRGGECCGYQGRKKRKTTNAIYVTDRQGIPLVMSTPVSGSHNDVYNISKVLLELFSDLKASALSVSGLFLNADAGFDTEQFRRGCHEHEVFPNVAFNKRRGKQREEEFLDELLYEQRYTIERTNARMDSYRSVLNRLDTTLSSWKAWNYITFILILLKKIRKREKSR